MYAGVYGVFGIGYMAYILCNNSIVHGWTGLLPARVVPSGQRVVTSSVLYYTHSLFCIHIQSSLSVVLSSHDNTCSWLHWLVSGAVAGTL